ncbi:DNA polymerase III subunit gamma/tau, partial [Leptospira santarosai]|nr:DNA polymerase III subunit gamma/tau [Leptospira santarosai]
MAYQAFYRVYRPQSFAEMSGQAHVKQTLQNALLYNKTTHAYLFNGPRGTGKTSAAKIFAKALNCEKAPVSEPCNECETCKSITNGSNTDVIEFDAASNSRVEEIRDIIEKVRFAPANSRFKVYIIDEVHMLSNSAFNALLKTLEEPPAHVVFILATTEPHKLPLTIISRCQRFDFKRITATDIVD